MYKSVLRSVAILVGVLVCSLAFTACGGDEEDEPPLPDPETPELPENPDTPDNNVTPDNSGDTQAATGNLTSISLGGTAVFSFTYDSDNRVNGCRNMDKNVFTISYSPLSITTGDNQVMWSDISLNSRGFITKAKVVNQNYLDDEEKNNGVSWYTMTYDNDGHLTTWKEEDNQKDAKVQTVTWKDGNLVGIHNSRSDSNILFRYSDTPNTAKVFYNYIWMFEFLNPLVMTGLLGEPPAYFPSVVDGDNVTRTELRYKLFTNGKIIKESIIPEGGGGLELTYNYSAK